MIPPEIANVAKMRLLDGIGFTGSDQRDAKFHTRCRYRGHDSE
jgi:hypothetical protein